MNDDEHVLQGMGGKDFTYLFPTITITCRLKRKGQNETFIRKISANRDI